AGKAFDLCTQRREGVAALALDQLHLLLGTFERRFQRLDELRYRTLALLQRVLGDDLIASQRFAREPKKHFAVGTQGFAAQRIEDTAQPCLGLAERRETLALESGFGLATHALAFERDLQRLFLAARTQRGQQKPDREPRNERNDGDDHRAAQPRSR